MRVVFILFAPIVYLISALPFHVALAEDVRVESIAAVVNGDAVSVSDVQARMKLIMVSSGLRNTSEMREKMTPQIVNSLIEESLMTQEAARLGISVPPEDIERGFSRIAEQNNLKADQFHAILAREGIPEKTLSDQIRAQMAWSQVVQIKLRPQVSVAESQVDALMERIQSDVGKPRYLVSEIFLPVESASDDSNIRQLADRLIRQMIEEKIPFQRIANQFSQAAGASRGGDQGWVREDQLPQEIVEVLTQMQEGDLSRPIRSLTGYHIVLLRKKSILTEAALPQREEVMNRIGLDALDRLQRRYLLDLKTAAFIERRGV